MATSLERQGMLPSPTQQLLPASTTRFTSKTAHRQRLIVRLFGSSCGLRPLWRVGHLVVDTGSKGLEHVGPSGVWQAANGWVTLWSPGRVAGACLHTAVWLSLCHTAERSSWTSSMMTALQMTPIRLKGGTD